MERLVRRVYRANMEGNRGRERPHSRRRKEVKDLIEDRAEQEGEIELC